MSESSELLKGALTALTDAIENVQKDGSLDPGDLQPITDFVEQMAGDRVEELFMDLDPDVLRVLRLALRFL